MGFRALTSLAAGSLYHAQAGIVATEVRNVNMTGHAAGKDGAGVQQYREILCGDECIYNGDILDSEANTTGTLFYPEIKYFVAFTPYGRDEGNVPSTELDIEIMAQSVTGHDFSGYITGGITTTYIPGGTTSYYFRPHCGDIIYGKFNRIAIFQTGDANHRARAVMVNGPSSNLIKE